MSPLEAAQAIERSSGKVHRDAASGLYVVDGTVPPTLMSFRLYEAGLRVLAVREKAAVAVNDR